MLYSFSILAEMFGMDDIAHVYEICVFSLHLLTLDFLFSPHFYLSCLLCSTTLLFFRIECTYSINAPVPPPAPFQQKKNNKSHDLLSH